jgi:serine/threonine protein kinase
VPASLAPRRSDDLLGLLPTGTSRFSRGMRPVNGVDLELDDLLGIGGFGEVWRARNPRLPSAPPVALKFCLKSSDREALETEIEIANRLMHAGPPPGIVRIQHTYLAAEVPFLEYEYVEGGDLAAVIEDWHRTAGGPTPHQAARVVAELAEIVGFAHGINPPDGPVVHRDLKPANILVRPRRDAAGRFKITEFGIGGVAGSAEIIRQTKAAGSQGARLLSAARGAYTPYYASPQQEHGEPADPRDDVYALGVIWYQLLTGDLNHGAPHGAQWVFRLTEKGMPTDLIQLLHRCVEDQPNDRPRDARALAQELTASIQKHWPHSQKADPGRSDPRTGSGESTDRGPWSPQSGKSSAAAPPRPGLLVVSALQVLSLVATPFAFGLSEAPGFAALTFLLAFAFGIAVLILSTDIRSPTGVIFGLSPIFLLVLTAAVLAAYSSPTDRGHAKGPLFASWFLFALVIGYPAYRTLRLASGWRPAARGPS